MGIFRDDGARDLLAQHMRECEKSRMEDRRDRELAASDVARKLELQNELTKNMHEQNLAKFEMLDKDANARFVKIMWGMITMLLTMIGALTLEIVKGYHGG